jgi:hypothetical protein
MDETGCEQRIAVCVLRGGVLKLFSARLRTAPRRGRSLTIVLRDDAPPR